MKFPAFSQLAGKSHAGCVQLAAVTDGPYAEAKDLIGGFRE